MARPRINPIYSSSPKWLHAKTKLPSYSIGKIPTFMKHLLIYYPKNFQAIKPLTVELYSQKYAYTNPDKDLIQHLCHRIMRRYKRDFWRYLKVEIYKNKIPKSLNIREAWALRLWTYNYRTLGARYLVLKNIKLNKRLETLELDRDLFESIDTIKQLKYLPSLKAINIQNVAGMPLNYFKRSLSASRISLNSVTLSTWWSSGYLNIHNWTTQNVIQLFRIIVELPNLKKLNFSIKTIDIFDVNRIPFNIMKKRGISYCIRVHHNVNHLVFSTPNELGLANLDLLGIHFKNLWLRREIRWDLFEETELRIQDSSQRALFLNLFEMKSVDLSCLFSTCRNIKNLDVVLSSRNFTKGISFEGLKYLTNLQHISIELTSLNPSPISTLSLRSDVVKPSCDTDLFRNLSFCAQRLKSVSLHIFGQDSTEKSKDVLAFFKACADTLTHITVKFSFQPNGKVKKVGMFYKGIGMLKRVESISIIYEAYTINSLRLHSKSLNLAFSNKSCLKEFCFSAVFTSFKGIYFNLEKLSGIKKLVLELQSFGSRTKCLDNLSNLSTLKHLEIIITSEELETWKKLIKAINKLKELEILLIHRRDYRIYEEASADLKVLVNKHSSLKFLAFASENDPSLVWVYTKDYSSFSWIDTDSFFGRLLRELPRKRIHRIITC